MKKPLFTGVCTALVTPFRGDSIDFSTLDRLIDRQLDAGVRALAVCGTTGEAAALSTEERMLLIQHTVSYVAGRAKVIAGTGTNCTADAIHMSRMAQSIGADGLLVVTPYYNKTSQAGLVRHYEAVANAVSIPVIAYNAPSRTGMKIEIEAYGALSKIENLNGVKEASGDLPLIARIRNRCGDDLNIWSGNDDTICAMMSLDAKGVISTTANLVPKEFVSLCNACLNGDYTKGGEMQTFLMPLIDAMFCDVNPMPVKAALELAGFGVGPCRAPLWKVSEEAKARIQTLVEKLAPA